MQEAGAELSPPAPRRDSSRSDPPTINRDADDGNSSHRSRTCPRNSETPPIPFPRRAQPSSPTARRWGCLLQGRVKLPARRRPSRPRLCLPAQQPRVSDCARPSSERVSDSLSDTSPTLTGLIRRTTGPCDQTPSRNIHHQQFPRRTEHSNQDSLQAGDALREHARCPRTKPMYDSCAMLSAAAAPLDDCCRGSILRSQGNGPLL